MTNTFLTFVRSLALSCLLVAGLAGQAAAAPILSFDPQTTNVNVGDTFSVDLILSDFADLGPDRWLTAFGLQIDFDDSIIDFDSATYNPSFSTTSAVEGTGTLSLSASGAFITPTNPYTLATLQFTALQAGSTALGFERAIVASQDLPANTTNSTEVLIFKTLVNGNNGLVNVERVPEPATLALFGVGAAVLLLRSRTRARQ